MLLSACGAKTQLERTAEYLKTAVPEPGFGSLNGDWIVFGLARAGADLSENYFERYYNAVEAAVQAAGGMLDENRYTEYSRPILARQNPDGGWSLGGGASDPDLTAMALQALAKYRSRTDVSAAVEAGLSCLSQLQQENGAFLSWDAESSEAVSQVLVALTELGLSPDDARFVKNGQTLEDVLLRFAQSDGSFAHTPDGRGNLLASTQAFYALAAVQRAREGKTTLYDMSDIAP